MNRDVRSTPLACWILAAGLVAGVAPHTLAQEARGTVLGRVGDESGGVVPGALVEVSNVSTGVTTPTTSNEQGNYRVPFLIPGTYRIAVTLEGFSKFLSPDFTLHVADVLTVDATLATGALTDEVTVRATAMTIDRSSASLGQSTDGSTWMPSSGRRLRSSPRMCVRHRPGSETFGARVMSYSTSAS